MSKRGLLRLAALPIPALMTCAALGARAQARDSEPASARVDASAAVAQGAFSPWSAPPAQHGVRASAWILGGYETAGQNPEVRSLAEAKIRGPFALRAGVNYDGLAKATRPFVGGRADLLNEARDGLNLAAIAQLQPVGFNTVPELGLGIALGRRIGRVLLFANAGYAQGLQAEERNASAGLAALVTLNEFERLGFDSKLQIDLERDGDEPAQEPDFRLVAGPLSTTTLGSISVSVGAGLSTWKYRLEPATHVGAIAYTGLGLGF